MDPHEPLQVGRGGAQTSGRAAGVRQWLCKHRLFLRLALMGLVAGLAVTLGYVILVRQRKLIKFKFAK